MSGRLYRLRRIAEVAFFEPGIYQVRNGDAPVLEMQAEEPVSVRRFRDALHAMAQDPALFPLAAPHGTEVAKLMRGPPLRAGQD